MATEIKMICPKCGNEDIIKHGFIERHRCPKCGDTHIVKFGTKVTLKHGERKRCRCGNLHIIYSDELETFTDQRYMCGKGHTFYKEDTE